MMGYTYDQVSDMITAIETAHEIIDGPADVERNLMEARDLLQGLLAEGRV